MSLPNIQGWQLSSLAENRVSFAILALAVGSRAPGMVDARTCALHALVDKGPERASSQDQGTANLFRQSLEVRIAPCLSPVSTYFTGPLPSQTDRRDRLENARTLSFQLSFLLLLLQCLLGLSVFLGHIACLVHCVIWRCPREAVRRLYTLWRLRRSVVPTRGLLVDGSEVGIVPPNAEAVSLESSQQGVQYQRA